MRRVLDAAPQEARVAQETQEAQGMAVIVRDNGACVLLADCPVCPDGGIYGHAVLQPSDGPGTFIRDPQARCDRCGAIYVFEIGWTEALVVTP